MYSLSRQVTIASGTAESGVLDTEMHPLVALYMPSAWTAANVTFRASDTEDGVFLPVFDDTGTEIEVSVDADRVVSITGSNAEALASLRYIKVASGTSVTPVNQAADRTIIALMK